MFCHSSRINFFFSLFRRVFCSSTKPTITSVRTRRAVNFAISDCGCGSNIWKVLQIVTKNGLNIWKKISVQIPLLEFGDFLNPSLQFFNHNRFYVKFSYNYKESFFSKESLGTRQYGRRTNIVWFYFKLVILCNENHFKTEATLWTEKCPSKLKRANTSFSAVSVKNTVGGKVEEIHSRCEKF